MNPQAESELKPDVSDKLKIAVDRLNRAIALHNPVAVIGLFSGGHDSFSACYVASQHPKFTAAVHINTGTGIEATRDYVIETCSKRGWPLLEFKAKENRNAKGELDPQDYSEIVRRYGFPGPFGHGIMYVRLKQRALQALGRQFKANCRGKSKKRILLVSGARTKESTRRMGNTKEVQIDGNRIWVAPIHDWTKLDTSLLLEQVGQPRNIIVDLIHKSGECLCGAFAKRGELEELALWPQTRPAYDRIKALEAEVKLIHGWGWGEKPLKKQTGLIKPEDQHLCQSCNARTPVAQEKEGK